MCSIFSVYLTFFHPKRPFPCSLQHCHTCPFLATAPYVPLPPFCLPDILQFPFLSCTNHNSLTCQVCSNRPCSFIFNPLLSSFFSSSNLSCFLVIFYVVSVSTSSITSITSLFYTDGASISILRRSAI